MSEAENSRALPKVALGRSGMQITRVGFGSWAVGGESGGIGWGRQDDADSVATIRSSIELGINWIDTAPVYGQGHSEEVVAEALRSFPKSARPYVFTKCGVIADPKSPDKPPQRIGTAASIRQELEQSLRRLRVEIIDLYQMHWPPRDGTPVEEYWQTLLDLKREGKVRAVGLSNHDVAALDRAEKLGHVDSLQPPLSAIKRDSAGAEIPWCHAHETGVITYSPMQAGLLTGKFSVERAAALPPSDWRSRNEEFRGEKLRRNLALVEAMRPIAAHRGISVAALSVAWVLACPGVTAAIVGARKPEQVKSWVEAASAELTRGELVEIGRAIEQSDAGSGPQVLP